VQEAAADLLPVLRLGLSIATGAMAFGAVLLLAWAAAGAPKSIEADLLGMARKAIGRQ
jgi:hypothetical protein